MCNATSSDLISQVVQQRVNGDEMFTAFEISLAVQDLAKSSGKEVERHRHMKDEIHSQLQTYVDSGLYKKEMWDVGAPAKAFLYYPVTKDPSGYVPLQRRGAQVKVASVSPIGLPAAVAGSDPAVAAAINDDGLIDRRTDARGSLVVPASLLRVAACS